MEVLNVTSVSWKCEKNQSNECDHTGQLLAVTATVAIWPSVSYAVHTMKAVLVVAQ